MSNNIKVLVVGAGNMGKAYAKVLKAQNIDFTVITRKRQTAVSFESETGVGVVIGNLEEFLQKNKGVFTHAINAVNVEGLVVVSETLIANSILNILVEKPLGMTLESVSELNKIAKDANARVYVAYNRRYYASTEKALEIVREDGGVRSVSFEFTEWKARIDWSHYSQIGRERWLIGNSSHVIDLAFFFAGEPRVWSSYSGRADGGSSDIFVGSGITENNVYFSYSANWDAPGRWAVELMTEKHRLYFKPMEKLAIQNLNSVIVEEVPIDDALDVEFKPGIYKEVEDFLSKKVSNKLKKLETQLYSMAIYEDILYGKSKN